MVQRLAVILANEVDDAASGALVETLAIIGDPILVPDRMAERHVEPVDRPAVSIDEVGDLPTIVDLLQPCQGAAFALNLRRTHACSPCRSSRRVRAASRPSSARNPRHRPPAPSCTGARW